MKVAHLLEEYEMGLLGTELEQLWTAEGNRRNLQELAIHFNQQLLQQALEEAGIRTLDGEIETIYRLLTTYDTLDQVRIRHRLERNGVNVDELIDDFVIYDTILSYIK